MANPYQQPPGGYGAPQYYVPGAIYPGYYGAPQGYMAAPAAGQPYGVNIYGMPTAVPQYQVAQQPTVVAVRPSVRSRCADGASRSPKCVPWPTRSIACSERSPQVCALFADSH